MFPDISISTFFVSVVVKVSLSSSGSLKYLLRSILCTVSCCQVCGCIPCAIGAGFGVSMTAIPAIIAIAISPQISFFV